MRTLAPEAFHPVIRVIARAYFRIRLESAEPIPPQGPLIIAPNHVTYADPALVVLAFRRPVYFMAWSRLFEIPLFGSLIRYLRAFPVEVDNADPVATREAVRLLEAGCALMIFPEAGLTRDGRLQPFRLGMFRLATAHRIPI
ncbi:MAG: 1-acyl-sn-glycerol-3-phosphate acyltransferase, partial [Acidobacteria bacterium]